MADEEKVHISVGDISNMIKIIDVVSQRGAIRGNEMTNIGLLRDKLEMFLQQTDPSTPNEEKVETN